MANCDIKRHSTLEQQVETLTAEIQGYQVGDSYQKGHEHGSAVAARYKAERDTLAAELRALTSRYEAALDVIIDGKTARLQGGLWPSDVLSQRAHEVWRDVTARRAVLDQAKDPDTPQRFCFCPGGGEPDGLEHRPGCPLDQAKDPDHE